ncbi:unnamed protein product, partial [Meganyctiphanes norvegica]
QASNYLSEQDQMLVAQAEEELEYIDQLELEDEQDPSQTLQVQTRAVDTSYTQYQLANAIQRCTLAGLKKVRWDKSKRIQKKWTNVPYKAGGKSVNMYMGLTDGFMTGLGTIKVKNPVALVKDQNLLRFRLQFTNIVMSSKFEVKSPKVDAAPASNVKGRTKVKDPTMWIDVEVALADDGLPIKILKCNANAATAQIQQLTNANGNKYKPMYELTFKKGLRQLAEWTLEHNIKVKVNQALMKIKADGDYKKCINTT